MFSKVATEIFFLFDFVLPNSLQFKEVCLRKTLSQRV